LGKARRDFRSSQSESDAVWCELIFAEINRRKTDAKKSKGLAGNLCQVCEQHRTKQELPPVDCGRSDSLSLAKEVSAWVGHSNLLSQYVHSLGRTARCQKRHGYEPDEANARRPADKDGSRSNHARSLNSGAEELHRYLDNWRWEDVLSFFVDYLVTRIDCIPRLPEPPVDERPDRLVRLSEPVDLPDKEHGDGRDNRGIRKHIWSNNPGSDTFDNELRRYRRRADLKDDLHLRGKQG